MTTPPALTKEEREAVETVWSAMRFNTGSIAVRGFNILLSRSAALDAAEAETTQTVAAMDELQNDYMAADTKIKELLTERDALAERVKQLEEMLEELTHYTHIRKEGWLLKKMEAVLSRPPKDTTPGESQEPVKGEDAPGPVHQIHNGRTVCVGHLCDRHDEPGPKKEATKR